MKRWGKQSLAAIMSVAVSCSQDAGTNSLEKGLGIEQAKTALTSAHEEDNLIVGITDTGGITRISFEDGTSTSIDDRQLDHVTNDSAAWTTSFYFNDGSQAVSEFVGKLNIAKDSVVLDPFGTSPLTALAHIQTPVKGGFKITVHAKNSNGVAISNAFSDYGYVHELPVLGLYENYNNQVEFAFLSQSGKARASQTLTIPTPPLKGKNLVQVNINGLGTAYNGIYMVSGVNVGFDQAGDIRWTSTAPSSPLLSFMRKLQNGNMLLVQPDALSFSEVTMLGETIKAYAVPNGIHHDIIEMPTGNFLVTSNSNNGSTIEDLIVEVSRTSGEIAKSWDLNKILDPTRKTLPGVTPADWFHMNSLYFDPTDHSIIVSGRSQSATVKIDYAGGYIKWILGNPNYWKSPFENYLLAPADSHGNRVAVATEDFWPYGQHAVERLLSGNILMFDDGDFRGYYDNPSVLESSYSRGVEYAIDEKLMTVRLVWEFDHDKTLFTPLTGFIQQLPSTNRVIAYMDGQAAGNGPKVVEIDSQNKVLFDADVNAGSFYYRTAKYDLYEGIK